MQSRKSILDIFFDKIELNFNHYCQKLEVESTNERLLTFLVDQELISNSNIQHYAILAAFEDAYQKNGEQKTKAVKEVAIRFNLSQRSIWNVLRKYKQSR